LFLLFSTTISVFITIQQFDQLSVAQQAIISLVTLANRPMNVRSGGEAASPIMTRKDEATSNLRNEIE
jgi:hypothetical protein